MGEGGGGEGGDIGGGSGEGGRSSDDSTLDTRHARSRATHLVVVVLAEVGVVVIVVTHLLKRRDTQVSDSGETTQVDTSG